MKKGSRLGSMKKSTKSSLTTYLLALVLFLVPQTLMMTGSISNLLKGLLVPMCAYVIMAISLNLTVGILGELSLGHAGFMCVGAFASAFFSVCVKDTITSVWVRLPLAIIIGGVAAAIFGFIVGIPVLRLKGDYLAIVTLAFGEIIKNVVNVIYVGKDSKGFHFSTESAAAMNMDIDGKTIINGALGITGIPRDATFAVGFVLVIITLFVILNLIHSRDGRAIMAIRDNRIAAESIGINVTKYKLIAFVVSAFFAGIAGVLYTHNLSSLTATTDNFGYNMSIMILVYVVLGGIGNIKGSIIATIILTLLPEELRFLNDYRMLIYSIVLIVMMIFTSSPALEGFREKYSPKHLLKNKKKIKAKEAA